ncbi:MAG: archaeosine biosynthesis radical SAM protein RaSEA [Thermoplasmatota archaeon]
MEALEQFCRSLKRPAKGRRSSKPRMWTEKDVLHDEVVDAFVCIMQTSGCRWSHRSGCTMCGYYAASIPGMGEKQLRGQLEMAAERYRGEPVVKIFTSGSFLDGREVPLEVQRRVLQTFFARADKVVVETRPSYVSGLDDVADVVPPGKSLSVAMGLESANDRVLEYAVNKGFTFADWERAAEHVRGAGFEVKTYVLLKPPFLTEEEGIRDAVATVDAAAGLSHAMSLNPVAVHGNTLVEYLWKRNLYHPPWLWSVAAALEQMSQRFSGQLTCDVVAGGKQRGAHNCGDCDAAVLQAIEQFTLQGKRDAFEGVGCNCREEWLDSRQMGGFLQG